MRHVVEVDQSIKIEDSGSTVLAFADGIAHAIEVSANVKLAALQALYDRVANPALPIGWCLQPVSFCFLKTI